MFRTMTPQHINAGPEDMAGNNGLGRYILLTGSDGRAKAISEHFDNVRPIMHPRQHNFYLGQLASKEGLVDVAAIACGMGGGSADIIINELMMIGARRMLRIGTCGTIQPQHVHTGDLVFASGAVRDDKASWDYIYPEFPAMASYEVIAAAKRALATLALDVRCHVGIAHSKSSLFAREYRFSLLVEQNEQYMQAMRRAGVLVSEMECAQLFTLASLYSAQLRAEGHQEQVYAGAILATIGDETAFDNDKNKIARCIEHSITLGLETIRQMAYEDRAKA